MIQPEKTSKYAVVVSLLTLCFIACNGKASEISNHSSNPIVTIERFDKGLPSYVQETDSAQIFLFIDKYTPFFPVYCRHILGLGDAPSFQKGLKMFLSNEAISQLYADTETKFSNDTVWITELQNAFLRYNELFAPQKRPRILTHISGLNQSIVTIDTTLLSVSLDCYLGENYPLYEQRYYNYERNLHESNRIPIDVVEVWLRTLYPYQSQRNALLDRMIYEGKIFIACLRYFLEQTNMSYWDIPTNKLNGAKRTKLKYGNNLSVKSTCSIPNRCLSTSISSRPLSYRYFIKMHRDDWAAG